MNRFSCWKWQIGRPLKALVPCKHDWENLTHHHWSFLPLSVTSEIVQHQNCLGCDTSVTFYFHMQSVLRERMYGLKKHLSTASSCKWEPEDVKLKVRTMEQQPSELPNWGFSLLSTKVDGILVKPMWFCNCTMEMNGAIPLPDCILF